jgi:hypothetical protein
MPSLTERELISMGDKGEPFTEAERNTVMDVVNSMFPGYLKFAKLQSTPENVRLAREVIARSIREALPWDTRLPGKRSDVKKLAELGLENRKREFDQARELVHKLQTPYDGISYRSYRTAANDLGYSNIYLREIGTDLDSFHRQANPEKVRSFLASVANRKAALRDLSVPIAVESMKRFFPGTIEDKFEENVGLELQTPHEQSPIVRGALIREMIQFADPEANIDPMIMGVEAIDKLQILVQNQEVDAVISAQMVLAKFGDFGTEGTALLRTLAEDIIERCKVWQMTTSNPGQNNSDYMAQFSAFFDGFPIQSLVARWKPITTVDKLKTIGLGSRLSIWDNPEIFGTDVLPSLRDITEAIVILKRIDKEGQDLAALEAAQRAWEQYIKIQKRNPAKVQDLEERAGNVKPLNHEEAHELMFTNNMSRAAQVSGLERRLKRLRTRLDAQRIAVQLIDVGDIRPESIPSELAQDIIEAHRTLLVQERTALYHRNSTLAENIGRQDIASFTGWDKSRPRQISEPALDTISRLNNYLNELKNNPDQVLPSAYLKDIPGLRSFVLWYIAKYKLKESFNSSNRDQPTPDQLNATLLLEVLDFDPAALKDKSKSQALYHVRNWFITELSKRIDNYEEVENIAKRKRHLDGLLATNESVLGSTEASAVVNYLILIEEEFNLNRWIRMNVVEDATLKMDDLSEKIKQAEAIMTTIAHTRDFNIRFPDIKDWDLFVASQLEKLSDSQGEVSKEQSRWRRWTLTKLTDAIDNPFVPLRVAAGARLSEMVAAIKQRIEYLEAIQNSELVGEKLEAARETQAISLERYAELKERNEKSRLYFAINELKDELAESGNQLVRNLGYLGFVMPLSEYESLARK